MQATVERQGGAVVVKPENMNDYLTRLAHSSPQEAMQIAIAEMEKTKALAERAKTDYQSLSEIEFDDQCRITKANLAGLYRLARCYADSQLIPEAYRGKPSDCFIAVQVAYRMRIDPFAYMQASYIVHGKPAIEAKLAVAMLNTSGKIKGRLKYRETRDQSRKLIGCQAWAIDAETGEQLEGPEITWQLVKAEKWDSKPGSKWLTMPDMMFTYRAAMFFIRKHCPEVLMGMQTVDEVQDIYEEPAKTPPTGRISLRRNGSNTLPPGVGEGPAPEAAESGEQQTESDRSEAANEAQPEPAKPKRTRAAKPEPAPEQPKLLTHGQRDRLQELSRNVAAIDWDTAMTKRGNKPIDRLTEAEADAIITELWPLRQDDGVNEPPAREPGEDE